MLPRWRISCTGDNCNNGYIFIAPEQTRKPPALSASISGGGAWIEHFAQQAEREMRSRSRSAQHADPKPGVVAARFVVLVCEVVPYLDHVYYDSPTLWERIWRLWGKLRWEIITVSEQAAAHVYRALSEQGDASCCRVTEPHDLWDHARAIYFHSDKPRRADVQTLIASAPTLADTASRILCERLRRDGISKIDAQGWVGENFDAS